MRATLNLPSLSALLLMACSQTPTATVTASSGTTPTNASLSNPLKVRTNGTVNAVLAAPDGSTFIAGNFTTANPIPAPYFFSTSTAGVPDYTLNLLAGFNGQVYAAAALSDGSLIVGGNFTSYQGQLANYIAKISPAGVLDTTFNGITGSNGTNDLVYTIGVDASDNIYLGGCFSAYRGTTVFNITKVSKAGVIDTTFSPTGSNGTNSCVLSIALSGTNIFFGGYFSSYRGATANFIAEVDSTGTLNTTFTGAAGPNAPVTTVAVSGSKVYFGGSFNQYKGVTANNLAATDTSGNLDTTFTAATGPNNDVSVILVDTSGIYIGGYFTTYRGATANYIAKLDTSGNLDTTFSPGSGQNGLNSNVSAIAVASSALYVGGSFNQYRGATANYVAKLDTSGNLDGTFNPANAPNGFNQSVTAILPANNLLYFGGGFDSYGGTLVNNLVKLDPMGNIDPGFLSATNSTTNSTTNSQSGTVGTNAAVSALSLTGSSLFVGGNFTTYQGAPASFVAKVNSSTGVLDTTYNPSTGANGVNGPVYALASDTDNVYIGGAFTSYQISNVNYIAKTSLAGVLDSTFTPSSGSIGFDSYVLSLALSGTSLFVGGSFQHYRSSPANYIALLDATSGSLNTTLSPATGANGFNSMVNALNVNGSNVFAGGAFTTYRGATANFLAKLNASSGALDTTFNPASGANGCDSTVNSLYSNSTTLVAGGQFANCRGWATAGIAKMDLLGNVDAVFSRDPGPIAFSGTIYSISGQDNWIYVGGNQTSYQEQPTYYLSTLNQFGVLQQ